MGFKGKEFLLDKYSQGHNSSFALDLLKSKIFTNYVLSAKTKSKLRDSFKISKSFKIKFKPF